VFFFFSVNTHFFPLGKKEVKQNYKINSDFSIMMKHANLPVLVIFFLFKEKTEGKHF